MPPGETTQIWEVGGSKKSWSKGEYCVHWIIVNGRPTMFTFECLQDHNTSPSTRVAHTGENHSFLDALLSEMIIMHDGAICVDVNY
ncbi:uncharacterized protein BT62DRAFT_1081469 [Guyanagaster necrorhizus]|uniref:Uncharacterized protein n=1 Tax=Guyanagaster necrorhizus TaxID=856835 RepID=A0A9P7VF64_9AGAR|nr:uncharacterized protein BT62DRAFT_1081469 [Guyanagaster necrorhizus MCA 3950]KAG7439584.1 hypothetical protein BT62DRAFT_1081469 [Guyanagaster necrorhizus MCA 3950]